MQSVDIVPQDVPHHQFTDPTEIEMAARVANGELFEDIDDLSPGYRATLDRTLEIAAQGEVTVLTWASLCLDTCPDIGSKISLAAAMLDEVGHAHQQGMLWERMGRNMHEEAFNRPPNKYWSFPILEFKPKNYIEFLAAQSMLDRAGRYTTWDIERHCSFAPYRRCLKKVNYEEVFHFRHGAYWIEYYWNASAMSAMAQDSLGHTRATLHFLEKEYGYQDMSLEFNRSVDQVHGMDLLDRAPQSWGDFVTTLALAEHAIWQMMSTFDGSSIASVSGMLEAFGQENQFHRMNMDGWIKIFSDEERSQLWEALAPTTEEAKLARRPLAVSITDELDLYDRPNSKNWDFEPIAI